MREGEQTGILERLQSSLLGMTHDLSGKNGEGEQTDILAGLQSNLHKMPYDLSGKRGKSRVCGVGSKEIADEAMTQWQIPIEQAILSVRVAERDMKRAWLHRWEENAVQEASRSLDYAAKDVAKAVAARDHLEKVGGERAPREAHRWISTSYLWGDGRRSCTDVSKSSSGFYCE